MESSPSRLEVNRVDDALRLAGVIDSHTAGELEDCLAGLDSVRSLELDLSGVDFIDSSGLRAIVSHHKERQDQDRELVLTGRSEAVERLLEITGLTEHLHLG